jgi:putative hydrolase of the HAD superfamily
MLLRDLKGLKFDLWIFDNDGTLYPEPKRIESAFIKMAVRFIANYYNITETEAEIKRKELLKKHKTKYTLIALKEEGADVDYFIKETYLSLDPNDFGINRNEALYQTLDSLDGEKIVLSNNPSEFVNLILKCLGIRNFFFRIIGMRELNFVQKPKREAFALLESYLKMGKEIIFVDDELNNVTVAKEIGCTTILVGPRYSKQEAPDYWVSSLI